MKLSILTILYPLFKFVSSAASNEAFETRDWITGKQLQSNILDSSKVFLVFFFNSESDVNSNEHMELLSNKLLGYDIKIANINCSEKGNKNFCPQMNVPSMQLYIDQPTLNPYTRKYYRTPIVFNSKSPTLEDIEKFVSKKYPNEITSIKSNEKLTELLSSSDKQINSVLLLSEKDTTPIFFKSIAYHYKNKLQFHQIYSKQIDLDSLATLFPNDKVVTPSMIVKLKDSKQVDKETYIVYDKSLSNRDEMLQFLDKYIIHETKGKAKANDNLSSFSREETDQLDWNTIDKSVAHVFGVFPADTVTIDTGSTGTDYEAWKNTSMLCEGNVRATLIKCPSNKSSTTDSVSSNKKFGELLCTYDGQSLPYLYVLKYGFDSGNSATAPSVIDSKNTFKLKQNTEAVDAVYNTLPQNNIKLIYNQEMFQQFIKENHDEGIMTLLFLSKKTKISNLLNNIAFSASQIKTIENPDKGIVRAAFFADPPKDFLNSLGRPKVPGILTFSVAENKDGSSAAGQDPQEPGASIRVISYDQAMNGPIRHDSAVFFIRGVYEGAGLGTATPATGTGSSSSGSRSSTANSDSFSSSVMTVPEIKSESDWSSSCAETFRGLCTIGIFTSNANNDTNAVTNADYNSYLTASKNYIAKVNAASSGAAPFKFMSINGYCHHEILEAFNLQRLELPVIVAYAVSKKKYAVFRNSFTESGIKSFLESVLSGGASVVSLSQRPVVKTEECAPGDVSSGSHDNISENAEPEEDASDFLEEIRREELEKQKQMKKETEEELKRLKELQENSETDKNAKKKIKRVVKKKKKSSSKSEL